MNPPCPPFECAHMWGPSLVSVLKDASLHSSLRQPAFDLIETIVVSDASALVTSLFNCQTSLENGRGFTSQLNDEVSMLAAGEAEDDKTCWSEFKTQSNVTTQECRGWMCIPMLWVDVLADIHPSGLPISFSKAVLWARSRMTMVEHETTKILVPVKTWLSSSAKEISTSFGWKAPTGYDDGSEGNKSKNAIEVSIMQRSLSRIFNRLTEHFLAQIGEGELHKQWMWDSKMAESLILLHVDPNDNVRQFGKHVLEHVSNTRGLASGLKFLCSNVPSLSATFMGLQHALKVVEVDSVISKFQNLQHFFFVLYKLIKGGDSSNLAIQDLSDNSNTGKYFSQGGFLKHPVFDSLAEKTNGKASDVDSRSQEKFRLLLSVIAWPAIQKCLMEGKGRVSDSVCQMTCIRVLDILHVVCERIVPPIFGCCGHSVKLDLKFDFAWLHDLMDWGKSTLKVVIVYWKRAVTSLLNLFNVTCNNANSLIIKTIEDLNSCDNIDIDQLTAQVSLICVSLSKEVGSNLGSVPKEDSSKIRMSTVSPKSSLLKELSPERRFSTPEVHSTPPEDTDLQILDSVPLVNRIDKSSTIVLSDDEEELHISHPKVTVSEAEANKSVRVSEMENLRIEQDAVQHKKAADKLCSTFLEREIDDSKGKLVASLKSKDEGKMETKSKFAADISISGGRVQLKKSSHDPAVSETKQTCVSLVSEAADSILKELVHDKKDDPQKTSTKPEKPEKQQQQHLVKLKVPAPKRQVIQLQTHAANKFGNLHRLEARGKRFKPPKLDEWYRPILEINYFATVGLTSVTENENRRISRLREVPSSFQSPEEYVEVFHPLVLEEFKAQLYSSFVEMSSWEDIHFGCLSVLSVERVDDFHFVRFVHDDVNSTSKTFSENDLVLITKEAPQKGSHDVHMVGKVERRERDNKQRLNILLIRFYFLNGSSRLNQARRQLVDRSKWHASRIMSITPQLREFLALSSIKDNPILEVILQPMNYSPSNTCKVEQAVGKLSQPLQKVLRSTFNDSQLQAINVAIGSHKLKKDFELSLIQGPPGTGKTRTIVAIVSCLFSSLRGTSNTNMNQESGIGISFANARSKISKHVAVARAWQDAALARQINDDGYRNKFQEKNSERRRVLICAQSNAAVDELCSRIFSEGLYRSDGERYKPYLVRVGNVKTVHQNSLPFFIDTLVDQRLTGEKVKLTGNKDGVSTDSTSVLRSNLEKLVDSIRFYEAKCAKLRDGNLEKSSLENESEKGDDASEMTVSDLEVKLRKLYGQKKQFFKDLRDAEAKERKTNEEIRALRHKLRKSILKEAEIVLTTLSGCGGDLYGVCSEAMSSHKFGNPPEDDLFDAVVIDEAAQALEPATLIPLQLLKSNGTKCIMVGDPKQLPATVLSDVASKYLYECSMFERLERAGHPVVMLTKQYRMHPEICQFPSMHFYDNKLLNGEDTSCKSASFHETKVLGPYLFYDIMDGQELRGKNSGAMSLYNECEAEAAVELLRFFKKRYPSEFVGRKLGIITPYKSQLSLLRSRFLAAFGSSVTADFEFNTVDGFQGREVDILLLSTVRAADACSTATGSKTSTIGFVADVRRMNVALTRAKFSLWILGNSRTLMTNRSWKALLENAKERNLVISVERPYNNLFRNLGSSQPMENSKDKSKQLNHGGSAKEPGKLEKHRGQHGFHRNEKCVIPASQSNRMDTKHDNSVSTVKADGRDKRRAGDGNDPPGVADLPSVDVDTKSLSKKAAMSFELDNLSGVRKVHKGNKTKPNSPSSSKHDNSVSTIKADGREKRRSRDGNDTPTVTDLPFPDVDAKRLSKKAATSVELDTSGGRKGHKSSMNKPNETKKSNCHGPTLSVEGNTECGESQHTKTPKVSGSSTDRKQQRQAVDAILCSFLLPSKKGEPLAKSAPSKRPRSPTRSLNNGRKPPKTKRVHENEQ